jgi:hypothetical protein
VPLTKDDNTVETQSQSSARYGALLKSFLIRLCVSVTLAVIVMGAVELFSYYRYRDYGRDVLEPGVKLDLAENGTEADREYWKEYAHADNVLYHQYVLWRRAPYQGQSISVSLDGVRRTLHSQCDDKTFTVWMFGDSVMWGAGSTDAETIPSLIAQVYENSGKPACIVNYGEKGWSNTQEMIGLMELLKHTAHKPNVVLFYDGGTEAFAAYQSGEADVHSNFKLFSNFLDNWGKTQRASFSYLQQTNTYRFLERFATKMPFHKKRTEAPSKRLDMETLSAAVIENYKQNVDLIELLAKQYGFRPVFAWYPNLAVGHKVLSPYEEQLLRIQYADFPDLGVMYKDVYDKSDEIKNPDFYNLADIVDDKPESLYVGISHMKAEGDRIVAARLFNIIERKPELKAASQSASTAPVGASAQVVTSTR